MTVEPRSLPNPRTSSEADLRIDLAACFRALAHFGMNDTIYTHATARLPEQPDQILINPYGLLFEEVTASNLVKIDLEGHVLEPSLFPVNAAGFVVHSAIYQSRADIGCVIHTHTIAGAAVSALECGLLPISQASMEFYRRVGYHNFEGLTTSHDESERLAHDLGTHQAMILRNHGLLAAGASIPAAFETIYYLEQACRIQLAAQHTSASLLCPSSEICELTAEQYEIQGTMPKGLRLWRAILRLLDRCDPSYRE